MNFDTIYYHANCTDGVTAAALMAETTERFERAAIPCTYGKTVPEPDDYKGKTVAVVDFCFDQKTMFELARETKHLVVLDHHKGAKDLVLSLPEKFNDVTVVFGDNAKWESGAMLAWHFQNPDQEAPALIRKVAERDTWNFGEDRVYCETICAGLYHVLQTRGALEAAYYVLKPELWDHLVNKGLVVREVAKAQVERSLEHAQEGWLLNRTCVYVNEKFNVSELGEAILAAYPNSAFALVWFDDGQNHARISLRSRPGSDADCSAFAKELAANLGGTGGGHKHAAGCSVDLTNLMRVWY